MNFFGTGASVADTAGDNPNGNKTYLGNGVIALFINGKPAVINGLRKLRNHPPWLVNFLVVLFNNIPLFSKDLITFITSFISLLVRAMNLNQEMMKFLFQSFYQVN